MDETELSAAIDEFAAVLAAEEASRARAEWVMSADIDELGAITEAVAERPL